MGLMSSKIEWEKLRPGDHIYTWRSGYSYSHHGIYVGEGKVIHLTRGPGLIIFSSSSTSQPSNCDDRVECCNIQDFLCDGQLYRFEYGVGRFVFLMKRPGTCSRVSSRPPEQVLFDASYLLMNGFGNYHLLHKNCEGFAIYCKTGFLKNNTPVQAMSEQTDGLFCAFIAIISIPYQILPASLIDLALVVCGLYCWFRLHGDVGFLGRVLDVIDEKLQDLLSHAYNVIRANKNMHMTEKKTTRWFLPGRLYICYTIWATRYWYWTPENKILVWFKSYVVYCILGEFLIQHLRLHDFKLGKYSAYTIWLLGCLYSRWTSVSTILLWTRLCFLLGVLRRFVSHQPDYSSLHTYVNSTISAAILWDWTPRITILQWIKLALVYKFLFNNLISKYLRNHRLMRWRNHRLIRWEAAFVCFVIQSVALFM